MTRILSIIVLFFLFKIDAQNKDKVDSELKFKKEFIIDLEVGEISEPGNLFDPILLQQRIFALQTPYY